MTMGAQAIFTAALVVAAATGSWTFVALYAAWYPFWRSEPGLHLFMFVACLGLLNTLFAVAVFAPGNHVVQVATLGVYATEPLIVWWRVSLLVRTRRKTRTSRHT